jgi:vancomycin aglycone glucosyltransferase
MEVLLGAFGTRGDVQAGVVLARELVARGHAVSLFVSPSSLELARAQGLEARPLGLDYLEVSRRAGRGTLREMLAILPLVRDEMTLQAATLAGEAGTADLVVGVSLFVAGATLAEAARKPYAMVSPVPQVFPSSRYPSPGLPFQRLPRWLNRLSWSCNRLACDRLLLATLNRLRAARGLAPVGDAWAAWLGSHPILAADPALAPAPDDCPLPIAQVGALLLEDRTELSPEVESFLAAGPAPVYIGFGSMPDPRPERTTRRLLMAVRQAGVRAIISSGWAGLGGGRERAPDGVLFTGAEPHQRLFPGCAAVVHHGGAGTAHAAARAGVPQVVMPYLLDQHFWARRVEQAGVSAGTVRRHGRDPRPILSCLEDQRLRERARNLSAQIATDGARRAALFLEGLAAGR